MNSRISIDGVSDAVKKLLKEYGDEARIVLEDSVKEVAKESVKELKSASTGKFDNRTGEYRSGWRSQLSNNSRTIEAVIYNEKPGLVHLLEFGHVIKGGKGRITDKGNAHEFEHVAPIQEQAGDKLIETVERKLG